MNFDSVEELEQYARKLATEEKWSCAETVLLAMTKYWGIESPLIPRIATPFRGGLCGTQQVCGAVTGGLMALGAKMGRDSGSESSDACNNIGKAFMKAIEEEYKTLSCVAITGLDRSIPEQDALFHSKDRAMLCVKLVMRCCRWLAENVK
jgi:C_GCAxxG_C_C family probable redox protein